MLGICPLPAPVAEPRCGLRRNGPRCFAPRPSDEPDARQGPFAHPDAWLGPPLPSGYSRWVKSDVSFGPVGRTVLTILLLIPALWGLMYSPVAAALWLFVVYPVAMRSVWKKIPLRD